MARYTPYSYSKLALHKQCPRQYRYRYIDRIPTTFVESDALYKGKFTHSMLEFTPDGDVFKRVNDDIISETLAHSSKMSHAELQDVTDRKRAMFLEAKDIYINYLSSDTEKRNEYLSVSNTIHEANIAFDANFNFVSFHDVNAFYRGKIDLVVNKTSEDSMTLVDWKTGKLVEQRWQDFSQLLFYAVYFFMIDKTVNHIKISYVYVEHDQENVIHLKREFLETYLKDFILLIKNIESDKTWERNQTRLCDWCAYKTICDAEG